VLEYRAWGLGLDGTLYRAEIDLEGGTAGVVNAEVTRVMVARSFAEERFTVGAGGRIAQLTLASGGTRLFSIAGASLIAGGVWRPPDRDLRVGVAAALPVAGGNVSSDCDPESCAGYILPQEVVVPWELSAGAAWRLAASRWNVKIHDDFRDEHAFVLAADLHLVGAVKNAYGIEAFLDRELQPSGARVALSLRAGAEVEVVPGWVRLRAGGYWEPPRFADVSGRLHGTFGLDLRVWSFCLLGSRYRLRTSVTSDVARNYGNGGLALGFW